MRSEEKVLRVHITDRGDMYTSYGLCDPTRVSSPADFLQSLGEHKHIRMLGTAANAGTLRFIYENYCREGSTVLEVASPRICHDFNELRSPQVVLYRMRQCQLPASLGGWHKFTARDLPSYAIADNWRSSPDLDMRLLHAHPVYPALTFIPTLDPTAVYRLIAMLLDPRWFVSQKHSYRLSAVRAYLGLSNPAYLQRATAAGPTPVRVGRCICVRDAWMSKTPKETELEKPGNFLWRIAGREPTVRTTLAACHKFLAYMIRNWQHELMKSNPQQLDMFLPESFFQKAEVAAYKAHMAKYAA